MPTKASEIAADIRKNLNKRDSKGRFIVDVTLLSDNESSCVVNEWISTGCIVLDAIMGGGLPIGRMVEIYGSPSSGKSLIAAQIAATAQENGYIVGYVDTETAVSIPMMKKLGVNVDELIYTSPDSIEEVFAFFEEAMETRNRLDPDNILVLIWDSIASTSTLQEEGKEYGETGYLDHARIISQGLRKIMRKFSKQRVAVLFLNQTREKIGVMFGDKTATFGGKAVSFHASIRIALTLAGKIKLADKKKVVGMDTTALVVKNKVAMPFRTATLPIYFGKAIDDTKASLMWLEDNGFVTGASRKELVLEKETLSFKKPEWAAIYEDHFDEISDMILASNDDGGDDDAGETELEPASED
jgi:recombination protein RecA